MDVYICSTCISMHKHVNNLYPLVYLDKCSVSLNFYNIFHTVPLIALLNFQ